MILDIHTHHPAPQPLGVVDVSPLAVPDFIPLNNQLYSAGIHPWDTASPIAEETWKELERRFSLPGFAAVGEAGIDLSGRGGPLYVQLPVFRRQQELSEKLRLPLIVHCVKAEDVICGLRRDLAPGQPWIIHGFRKKPAAAAALLRAGCHISLGPLFNPDTLRSIPQERLLAETDDSDSSIGDVVKALSEAAGSDLRDLLARNAAEVLHHIDNTK